MENAVDSYIQVRAAYVHSACHFSRTGVMCFSPTSKVLLQVLAYEVCIIICVRYCTGATIAVQFIITCLYPVQFDFRPIIVLTTLVGALDTESEEKVRPTEESATRISLATP